MYLTKTEHKDTQRGEGARKVKGQAISMMHNNSFQRFINALLKFHYGRGRRCQKAEVSPISKNSRAALFDVLRHNTSGWEFPLINTNNEASKNVSDLFSLQITFHNK